MDKDAEGKKFYRISSHITNGTCAKVYPRGPNEMLVLPFLIKSYMGGITNELIIQAVKAKIDDAGNPKGEVQL